MKHKKRNIQNLVDVSDIFSFFLVGGGEGRVRGGGGGGDILYNLENPRRGGGVSGWMWEGGRGAGTVFAGNLGGGGKYLFLGPKIPTKKYIDPFFPILVFTVIARREWTGDRISRSYLKKDVATALVSYLHFLHADLLAILAILAILSGVNVFA